MIGEKLPTLAMAVMLLSLGDKRCPPMVVSMATPGDFLQLSRRCAPLANDN
jgi:hypothetical protein